MKIKRIIINILWILFICNGVYAYWVWTPVSKKWTNPKWGAKDTPKEQFKWAKGFYDKKKYKKSIKEFNKLISSFSSSSYAAESQYFIGLCYMDMKKYYHAYLQYQKTIEKYPGTGRMEDILAEELKIANYYYHKKQASFVGVKIPKDYEYCIEIYSQIVKNAPYSKYADNAQFLLAESFRIAGKFDEAVKAYNKLIERYPESKFLVESKYKIALCMSHDFTSDTSQNVDKTEKAIKEFEKFTKKHGDSSRIEEAKKEMNELLDIKAKQLFDTAFFYEKQKKYDAALIYYEELCSKYAETAYFKSAKVRMERLKK